MTIYQRIAAFIAFALVCGAAPSKAAVLLVNGTTPSVHYQRWADDFARRMPVPAGTIDLYLLPRAGFACEGYRRFAGCAMAADARTDGINDGRPAIYLDTLHEPHDYLRGDLAHELGHELLDLDDGILSDADRARFDMIWRRPAIGWWEPLRPTCDGIDEIDGMFPEETGADCGEPSTGGEWAAEAYRLCATADWRSDWLVTNLGYLPDRGVSPRLGGDSNLRRTRAPILATCGLIRDAAARRGG